MGCRIRKTDDFSSDVKDTPGTKLFANQKRATHPVAIAALKKKLPRPVWNLSYPGISGENLTPMVRIFTLAFILISAHVLAQVRTISGRLKASDGSPLPGVNVLIKGTTTGTTTDVDGFYSIEAPVGSTLVFSFIGMATREMLVTADQQRNPKTPGQARRREEHDRQEINKASSSGDTVVTRPGIATLSDRSPQYFSDQVLNPQAILSIRRLGPLTALLHGKRQGTYNVIQTAPGMHNKFGLQFTTAIGLESITRKPDLQNAYAQGESVGGQVQWMGPETGEIFSWGPLMRTLEFDGSSYAFDKKGRLVSAGSGNGTPAAVYNASNIFRTGIATENDLIVFIPTTGESRFMLNGGIKHRNGVVPGSFSTRRTAEISLKKFRINRSVTGDASVIYQHANGDLMNRAANLASITAAAWRTPVSFDNANGLSPKQAYKNEESYKLSDGSMRSHAPGSADNSYALVNEIPDEEVSKRLLSTLLLRFDLHSPFSITFNGSVDKQWNNISYGLAPGLSGYPNGRITRRDDQQLYINTIITPSYRLAMDDSELTLRASYQMNYSDRMLDRVDGFDFSDGAWDEAESANHVRYLQRDLSRTTHEVALNGIYQIQSWLTLRAANQSYFSNTITPSANSMFQPAVGFNARLDDLFYIGGVDMMRIYGSYLKTLREAPLIYNNWAYQSTALTTDNYYKYFESNELFFNHSLHPETEHKFETGISVWLWNHFTMEGSLYYNTTRDFIVPIEHENTFNLANTATVVNDGGSALVRYNSYTYSEFNWSASLGWSKYNARATELQSGEQFYRLAGFNNAAKVLAEGQQVGVLYGTTYRRDDLGRMVIGSDGFPLVDTSLKKIGNSIPDWTSFIDTQLSWKKLKLSANLEFRRGGQVWNGTRAALDYLGRSQGTGDARNVSNYVFEGVTEDGMPNSRPVSFYDPSKPVEQNRWVRYGFSGVGEEYIEDASWVRLNELSVSYAVQLPTLQIREARIAVTGRNLFTITPYSGVDPSTTLFGYAGAAGLDLFNAPATRTYTLQLTIKI